METTAADAAVTAGPVHRKLEGFVGLVRSGRAEPNVERRVVQLRYEAIGELATAAAPVWPRPWPDPAPDVRGRPPEIGREQLDGPTVGGAIAHHGCVLVRGLLGRDEADELRLGLDRAFDARDRFRAGAPPGETLPWYAPFRTGEGHPPFPGARRHWVEQAGGVLLADSPRLAGRALDLLDEAGLRRALEEHLGEPPVISVDKSTLRRVDASAHPSWHQDGSFFEGPVRTVNTWIALSPCGGDRPTPGLDVVPRRIDELARAGLPGAKVRIGITDDEVRRVAAGTAVLRPCFEPGDALLFDELLVHRTATDPGMTTPRYALELWSFAASAVPTDYFPLVW